jgi:hypothetical protein
MNFKIITALLLCSTFALAHDITLLGTLKSKETKIVARNIPSGNHQVDIWSARGRADLTCELYHNDKVITVRTNVQKCIFFIQSDEDANYQFKIKNLTADSFEYRLWIRKP